MFYREDISPVLLGSWGLTDEWKSFGSMRPMKKDHNYVRSTDSVIA